jgi:hypothetical protein
MHIKSNMCIHIYIYTYIHLYIYIYTYIHTCPNKGPTLLLCIIITLYVCISYHHDIYRLCLYSKSYQLSSAFDSA